MKIILMMLMVSLLTGCAQLETITEKIVQEAPDIITNTNTNSNHDLEVHFIDVGQGLSTLIITPDNKRILYDCGEEGSGALEYLQKHNIHTLDALIVSHPHSDHLGDCDRIIHSIPTKAIFDNGMSHSSIQYKEYADALTGENHYDVRTDQKISIDQNIKLELIVPYDNPKGKNTKTNDNSILLRIDHGSNSFLLTGDCESECEKDILLDNIAAIDVLEISHHGSNTASTYKFMTKTNPKIAIISVGKNNRYDHPHNETLTKLLNTPTYRTSKDGTTVLISDSTKITQE